MLAPDVWTSFHRFPTGVAGRHSIRARLLQPPSHRSLSLSLLQFLLFSLRFVVGGGFWTAFADAFLARVFFGLERRCVCRQRFWRSLIIFLLLACGFLESRCLLCGFVHRKREIVLWERERERERENIRGSVLVDHSAGEEKHELRGRRRSEQAKA
jgi:hypothetical protein